MKALLLLLCICVMSCKDGFDVLQDKFDNSQSRAYKLLDSLNYYQNKRDYKSAARIDFQIDVILKYQDMLLDAQTQHIKTHETFPF